MADDRRTLKALCQRTSDADLLNEMIGLAANRLMELETDVLCNAGRPERSGERTNYRNGYRPRTWETRAGAVELKIPKLRKGSYFPSFWSTGGLPNGRSL
jgi:putative transposase